MSNDKLNYMAKLLMLKRKLIGVNRILNSSTIRLDEVEGKMRELRIIELKIEQTKQRIKPPKFNGVEEITIIFTSKL